MKPFLPWPGNKSKIKHKILAHFPKSINVYHEPFLGSGAVFFALEEAGIEFKAARLSDTNKNLVNCWQYVQVDPQFVARNLTEMCAVDSEERYYKARQFMWMPAHFIYAMRAAFSSIYRENQSGEFNVPWRKSDFLKGKRISADMTQLLQCGEYFHARDVKIICQAFQQALRDAGAGDMAYLDPPYLPYMSTGFVGYTKDGFGWEEHKQLHESIREAVARGVKVVLSNSATQASEEIFGPPTEIISTANMAKSTATTKGKRQEGIWVW